MAYSSLANDIPDFGSIQDSDDLALKPSLKALGRPVAKKRIRLMDLLAVLGSFICLALAITSVASESVSWRLAVGTNQLIVVGFLISVMNLCLASVAPNLFLLLEARFGPSTVQNYDGIIRNSLFASRLSLAWRMILAFMLLLPLGLSVAYKQFVGGESMMVINPADHTGNTSYYGMFAPPGVQSLGQRSGITLFFNATLAFATATTPANQSIAEPALPTSAEPYGFNILLLNPNGTAVLDIPQPDFVDRAQSLLADGESWRLTASVLATVATYNNSKETDPEEWNSTPNKACSDALASSGAYAGMTIMMNGYSIQLLTNPSPGDQSRQYIGITESPGNGGDGIPCSNFTSSAKRYDITRRKCKGTWIITRGTFQLVEGSCENDELLEPYQVPIINNILFLPDYYMSSLMEFLWSFSTTRNQSVWADPYYATAIAAMVWSSVVANDGTRIANQESLSAPWAASPTNYGADFSYEKLGLLYPVNDTATYVRPTLRKSVLLYTVLGIQPLLSLAVLALTAMLYFVPLDMGFGLISILSGIDKSSLGSLRGAGLSGQLREKVRLLINPTQDTPSINYSLVSMSDQSFPSERLSNGVVYQ